MRTYEKTHPWLTFQLDTRRIGFETWLKLGEIQSKIQHISRVPLRPDKSQELHRLYFAKGARATAAIEGNTLSEEEVLQQIDGKLSVTPSKEYLKKEMQNILDAFNEIGDNIMNGKLKRLSVQEVKRYNSVILDGLELEESVVPGEIRTHSVAVTGARYRGAPTEDCEYLLQLMCD